MWWQHRIETFNVKKSTTVETLFNTVLSIHTMSSRMEFTGLMMYSYFDKCLLHNALEEWHSVMPHDDDQTVKNFKFSFEQWFTALQPNNVFLAQTEWMINTMRKSDIMKVKGFGNRLKTLNFSFNMYASWWQKQYSVLSHWLEGFAFEINAIIMANCIFVKSCILIWWFLPNAILLCTVSVYHS